MKIIITGSTGFLGSHIARHCESLDYEVSTVSHRLLNDPAVLTYKLRKGFDYLIHAAAYGNYYDQQNESQIIESNILYTYNLLQATKNISYHGFIHVSSSSVYGAKNKPMDEQDVLNPETMYAATKASAEYIVRAFALKYKKPAFSVRPFTIYGPGDSKKHLIPTVIDAIKMDHEINLDPLPSHDYIYVDDVVEAILKIRDEGKQYPGTAINLGNGLQYTNQEVVDLISKALQKKAKIKVTPGLRSYDSKNWCADTQMARFLGVNPSYDLPKGLMEIIYGKQKS